MEQTQWLDEREIGRLVGAYADMLLRIALNRTQNLAEAEDIVQSVFERLVTVKPRFENREHEKAWLIRTAVNLCKDYQKSAARRRNVPLDEETVSAFPAETSRCSTRCADFRRTTGTRSIFSITSASLCGRLRRSSANAKERSVRGCPAHVKSSKRC